MALDSGYWESENSYMSADDIATLLVKLYADYKTASGGWDNDDYAKAVGAAIRMLTD